MILLKVHPKDPDNPNRIAYINPEGICLVYDQKMGGSLISFSNGGDHDGQRVARRARQQHSRPGRRTQQIGATAASSAVAAGKLEKPRAITFVALTETCCDMEPA